MASVTECYVICDVCGEPSSQGGEFPAETLREAREHARENGWASSPGRDLCPDHRGRPSGDQF